MPSTIRLHGKTGQQQLQGVSTSRLVCVRSPQSSVEDLHDGIKVRRNVGALSNGLSVSLYCEPLWTDQASVEGYPSVDQWIYCSCMTYGKIMLFKRGLKRTRGGMDVSGGEKKGRIKSRGSLEDSEKQQNRFRLRFCASCRASQARNRPRVSCCRYLPLVPRGLLCPLGWFDVCPTLSESRPTILNEPSHPTFPALPRPALRLRVEAFSACTNQWATSCMKSPALGKHPSHCRHSVALHRKLRGRIHVVFITWDQSLVCGCRIRLKLLTYNMRMIFTYST